MNASSALAACHTARRPARYASLRIALVADAERDYTEGLADDLRRLGHQVQLIRRGHRWEQPKQQECFLEILVPPLATSGWLVRQWREQTIDVVHVVGDGLLAALALGAARSMGLPVSADLPDSAPHGRQSRLAAAWRRRLQRRADAVLVSDLHQAARLREQGIQRLRLAPRGIDLRQFHPSQRSFSLRHQWGVRADTPVLVHVGPLNEEPAIAALRAAMRALCEAQPDARLLLLQCDRIPPQIDALCPLQLEDWQDRSLSRVQGERRPSLATLLASADLLLVTRPAGSGQLIPLSLACGLAVLAQRDTYSQICLEDGHTGYLADDVLGDGQAYAEAMSHLLASPAALARLRLRAPASVAHLERSHAAARLTTVLQDLVRSHERCRSAAIGLVVAVDA